MSPRPVRSPSPPRSRSPLRSRSPPSSPARTLVHARLHVRRNGAHDRPLVLDGEVGRVEPPQRGAQRGPRPVERAVVVRVELARHGTALRPVDRGAPEPVAGLPHGRGQVVERGGVHERVAQLGHQVVEAGAPQQLLRDGRPARAERAAQSRLLDRRGERLLAEDVFARFEGL